MSTIDKLIDTKKPKDIPKAKVIAKIGSNIYKVRDDLGRYTNVYGSQSYNVGATVRISNGTIVGSSTTITKTKTIQV
jgi:hypothetical protein